MVSGLVVNEGTQTAIAVDTVGTLDYGIVKIDMGGTGASSPFTGTITEVANLAKGTITRLEGGTVSTNVLSGSIAVIAGTIGSLPNTPGGTLNLVTRVGNVGTLEVGTISSLPNIPGGTIGLVSMLSAGTVSMINAGTITSVGTVPGVGVVTTVTNLSNGTIQNSGTTTGVGVVSLLSAGTITKVEGGTIGLVTRVGNVGTLEVGTISSLPNLPQGSINVTAGTITAGSIVVTVGTITHGTVDAGTVRLDGRPNRNVLTYGTTFANTSGSAWATIVGSAAVGAGTYIWVNDISVNNPAGSAQCIVAFGTALNGTAVLLKGNFGTQVGVGQEKIFPLPVNGGMTNQDLTAYIGVPGTVDFNISYYISA